MGIYKTRDEYKNEAIELLNKFINDTEYGLNGNIDNLKDFSFWKIAGHLEYSKKVSADADRTDVAYAIAYLLYDDIFKFDNLIGFDSKSILSGETICTFNTLFSRDFYKQEIIAKKIGIDDFQKNIRAYDISYKKDFYHLFQSIGNIMVMPCKTINRGTSLNTLKGLSYGDYIYPFMIDLKEAYFYFNLNKHPEKKNKIYECLIKNKEFLSICGTFEKYVEIFKLKGWENLNLGESLNANNLIYGWEDAYREQILDYIKKVNNFIENRAVLLLEDLKIKLLENGYAN